MERGWKQNWGRNVRSESQLDTFVSPTYLCKLVFFMRKRHWKAVNYDCTSGRVHRRENLEGDPRKLCWSLLVWISPFSRPEPASFSVYFHLDVPLLFHGRAVVVFLHGADRYILYLVARPRTVGDCFIFFSVSNALRVECLSVQSPSNFATTWMDYKMGSNEISIERG